MAVQDWVIIIAAVSGAITSIIGAVFAGFITLKQLPKVHTQLNGESLAKQNTINSLADTLNKQAEQTGGTKP